MNSKIFLIAALFFQLEPAWAGAVKAPPGQVKVLAAAKAPLAPSAIPLPSLIPAAPQISDNGGGGEGPGDPPGGGGAFRPGSLTRRVKPSSIRTREQFVKFLIDKKVPEHMLQSFVRGVVDELMIRGDAAGYAFGEEETVRAAVRVIGPQRERFIIGASRHQSVPELLTQYSPDTLRLAAGSRIMLNRAHQEFRNLPGYDQESVYNLIKLNHARAVLGEEELSWEEVSRQIREPLGLRDQTIKRLRNDWSQAATKSLFRNAVFPLVGAGFAEVMVLRALNRVYAPERGIYDLRDLCYLLLRETVIERLSPDRRYSRRRVEHWFSQRDYEFLTRRIYDEPNAQALILEIKQSLSRRRH